MVHSLRLSWLYVIYHYLKKPKPTPTAVPYTQQLE